MLTLPSITYKIYNNMPNNIDRQITFICFSICLNMHKYAHVIYSIYNTILKNSKVEFSFICLPI